MDCLKRKRTQLRREFTKLEKKFLSAFDIADEDIEPIFSTLNGVATALFDVEAKLTDAFCESKDFDEAAFEEDQDKALEYKLRWDVISTKYKSIKPTPIVSTSRCNSQVSLKSDASVDVNTVRSNRHVNTKNVKMPKLELAKFDGDVKNWIQFWGQFSKIHEDADTDAIDKFQYLIQSTTENSPARQLVISYPPSAANYPKAIDALKARFARDDMLIETYVRGLLSLVWSQLKGDTSCNLSRLYDNLQTHLQALETLNITTDKFASILYPMIESALPEDILRSWNRIRSKREFPREEVDDELSRLMSFLRSEVESEELINMARQGFSQSDSTNIPSVSQPTACFVSETKKDVHASCSNAGTNPILCLWCDKETHTSTECYKASRMSPKERIEFVKSKKACLICLKQSHITKKCRYFPKCLFCKKRHVTLMCQTLPERKDSSEPERRSNNLLCQLKSTTLLQTLAIKLISDNKEIFVRVLIDSGAQRSYIKKDLARQLGLKPVRVEKLTHCLFGGIETCTENHSVYDVCLKSLCNDFSLQISVLGQENICGILPKVRSDVLIEQLRQKGIILTESTATPDDVTLLIGADFSGMIMTGNFLQLDSQLTAVQTKMGWTIQGPVTTGVYTTSMMTNLHSSFRPEISDLWDLEILGIRDPSEQVSKQSRDKEVLQRFNETISVNEETRYEVCLAWRENILKPEPNYEVARKRLLSTTKRLESLGRAGAYDAAFKEWLALGIIEEAPCQDSKTGDAVIKESSAKTKIRPVFDASAKDINGVSLNSCLEKSANLIELIPNLLIDFRKEAISVSNMLNSVDWNNVVAFSKMRKIRWNFLPPSAPWWGGFYERLIGVVKQMLVRVLGRALLTLTEFYTVLCDCEATMNNRPLTYFANNTDELRPLTPSYFIQTLRGNDVGDIDEVDNTSLNVRAKYCQTLRDNFRQRFRSEYISHLIQKGSKWNTSQSLKVGDVVLIESDCKRLLWPLGIVEETYIGRDGHDRVAKVRTASGHKVRPFQRLYPLELHQAPKDVEGLVPLTSTQTQKDTSVGASNTDVIGQPTVTRFGRLSRPPARFNFM